MEVVVILSSMTFLILLWYFIFLFNLYLSMHGLLCSANNQQNRTLSQTVRLHAKNNMVVLTMSGQTQLVT